MAAAKIEIFNLREDPDLWENLIEKEIAASASDSNAQLVVESMCIGEQIAPGRIVFLDQLDLPVAPPSLHGALAPGRDACVVVTLEIDQPIHPIPLGETFERMFASDAAGPHATPASNAPPGGPGAASPDAPR